MRKIIIALAVLLILVPCVQAKWFDRLQDHGDVEQAEPQTGQLLQRDGDTWKLVFPDELGIEEEDPIYSANTYAVGMNQNVDTTATPQFSRMTIAGSSDTEQFVIKAYSSQTNANPLLQFRDDENNPLLSLSSDHSSNVFLGYGAGISNTQVGGGFNGTGNTFVGNGVGASNTTGYKNTVIGANGLQMNTTGYSNTAVGYNVFQDNQIGWGNTAIGEETLWYNVDGTLNVAIGRNALSKNVTGDENVAVGNSSLYNSLADKNTAIGHYAGLNVTSGAQNILVGYAAGDNITTGSSNILIGYSIDAQSATGSNQLSIGNIIFGIGVDGLGTAVSTGKIGIKDIAPDFDFTIATGKSFGIGAVQWNSGDYIDGTKVANADLGDIIVNNGVWTVDNILQDLFNTIAVSGQDNIVADSPTTTLNFAAGTNIVITTNAATKTVTIASSAGGGGAPIDATYIVQSGNGSLTNEQVATEGTGIDFILNTVPDPDTFTIAFDSTEIGTTTWGAGSGITWTFDASAGTDSQITFGDGVINVSTGALQKGGSNVLTAADIDTSLKFANILTDEQGSGKVVFDTSPTLTTPILGAATATSITSPAATNLTLSAPSGYDIKITPSGTAGELLVGTNAFNVDVYNNRVAIGSSSYYEKLNVANGGIRTGGQGTNGYLVIYSEQGANDYTATLYTNTAMTSNANFYLPPDEPAATYLLNMTSGGVIGFDTNTYLTSNQTITLSGDVSGSGTTSITTTIGTDVIDDTMIDFGSGTGQVNTTDIPEGNNKYCTFVNIQAALSNDFHNIGGTDATDDTVSGTELDGVFSTTGLLKRTGAATYTTITDNSGNWDTAYGWGNHASAGYFVKASDDLDDIAAGTTNVHLTTTLKSNYDTAYTHSQATTNVHGLTFTTEGADGGLDADSVDGQHYNSNWPTILTNIQSACTNDFHNIGGADDDTPEGADYDVTFTSNGFLVRTGVATYGVDGNSYSLTSHNHSLADLSEKSYNSLTNKPTLPQNEAGAANNFLTAYNSTTGAFSKVQPTWANIDKTTSNIADITTRSHTSLTDIGTNTHAQIDTFISSKAQASGLASLDVSSLVVQNPANATATPTASKIPIANGSGKLDDWITLGPSIDISSETNLVGDAEIVLTGDALSIAAALTRDTEWDSETDVQTVWGGVNIILATEIDTSAKLAGILIDETGTGKAVFATSPVFLTGITLGDSSTASFALTSALSGATDPILTFSNNLITCSTESTAPYMYAADTDGATASDVRFYTAGTLGSGGRAVMQVNRLTDDGNIIDLMQAGTVEGSISVSGTTIAYGTFVGVHYTQPKLNQKEMNIGTIVVSTGEIIPLRKKTAEREDKDIERFVYVEKTSTRGQKGVYGVWFGKLSADAQNYSFGKADSPLYQIASLGLFVVRVTDTAGNIQNGDYIQSSPRLGEGERQIDETGNYQPYLMDKTVAKSLVDVDWSKEKTDPKLGYKWKLIPATIHAG